MALTIVTVTGHRPPRIGGYDNLVASAKLAAEVTKYFERIKPDKVITGMALGFDQIVASVCVRMGIPFLAAIPFKGQESRWPKKSQEAYRTLLELASEIEVVAPGFSRGAMQVRNVWMVDHGTHCLGCWDGTEKGGTYNCLVYARKCLEDPNHQMRQIDTLNPSEILREKTEEELLEEIEDARYRRTASEDGTLEPGD
jgi:uncharacterized phage-like protein YoqJ